MRLWRKDQNPLWIAFWGLLISLPFWIVSWHGGGIAVIIGELLFIVLYLRHSYFAWHVALLINVGFAVHNLFGRHPRVNLIGEMILFVYLLVARKPYVDYIRDGIDSQRI